jgi:ribosomal protein L37AE/L43A
MPSICPKCGEPYCDVNLIRDNIVYCTKCKYGLFEHAHENKRHSKLYVLNIFKIIFGVYR